MPTHDPREQRLPVSGERHEPPTPALTQTQSEAAPPAPDPATVDDVPAPAPERTLGPYRILAALDEGRMGIVYHARDERLGREVALKMIRGGALAHPDAIERFRRETRAVAQLEHPNIIPLYDVGQIEGQHYFTMALARAGSLARHRARFEADRQAAVALLIKVARAVQHVHEHGLLHRDLKPGNILLGDGDEPLISDFGLAKAVGGDFDLTRSGVAVGTLAYMAPEQASSQSEQIGPGTDVWALGVIAYELLCGRRPFIAPDERRLTAAILHDPPRRPRALKSDLPRDLETIVLKCLEKAPGARYASAGALADDLDAWRAGQPIQARPVGRLGRLRRWLWRHARLVGAAVAACLGVAAIFLLPQKAELDRTARLPAMYATLQQRQPVTLLGDHGPPAYWDWLIPGREGTASDGVSTIEADAHTLLLLLPDSHVPPYRVSAEVRMEPRTRGAGVFVSHTQHATVNGPLHAEAIARLNPQTATTGLDLVHLVPGPKGYVYRGMQTAKLAPLPAAIGGWHTLAVEVSQDLIRMSVQDVEAALLPQKKRVESAGKMLLGRNDIKGEVHPVFGPRGGVGLYVEGGAASFRQVIITPLATDRP
jgi:hypothetical protein